MGAEGQAPPAPDPRPVSGAVSAGAAGRARAGMQGKRVTAIQFGLLRSRSGAIFSIERPTT